MFEIKMNGRKINPKDLAKELEKAVVNQAKQAIKEKVGTIRHPETGEFINVVSSGNTLKDMKVKVEGSPELIELAKERLGILKSEELMNTEVKKPNVFLSYASEDLELAKYLAETLMSKGIDVWWAEWEMKSGDSIRQKIDSGISGCTHFLVLLTPTSITKPWVNQEIDAGFFVTLTAKQCKFIPLRSGIAVAALPPLLGARVASEIVEVGQDMSQLVNDIYDITKKPAIGPEPEIVKNSVVTNTGYSPAANAVAKYFVENSEHGLFADPQISVEDLAKVTGMTLEDTEDALYELSGYVRESIRHVLVESSIFPKFDGYWKPWKPKEDAMQLAVAILNDKNFPTNLQKISELYSWPPRRLNSAISYLFSIDAIADNRVIGCAPYITQWIQPKDGLRRFVKSRS